MNEELIRYIIWVLNQQYAHSVSLKGTSRYDEQKAYYDGLFEMANIVVSNGYKKNSYFIREGDNNSTLHTFVKED